MEEYILNELNKIKENQLDEISDMLEELGEEGSYNYLEYDWTKRDKYDYITEIADNNVDIYYSVLDEYNDSEYMNKALIEGFVDTKNYDIYKHKQSAQYLENLEIMYGEGDIINKIKIYQEIKGVLEDGGIFTYTEWEKVKEYNGEYEEFDYEYEDILALEDSIEHLIDYHFNSYLEHKSGTLNEDDYNEIFDEIVDHLTLDENDRIKDIIIDVLDEKYEEHNKNQANVM